MPARVVDASVLGAAVFREPRAQEAMSLLSGVELYAPTLLAYEMTSLARKKILLYRKRQEELSYALGLALSSNIRWVEVGHEAVLRLAVEKGLTTYDACYLYLARLLGTPLVTFDERLRAAAGAE